mmetsp:Transcript_21382/g.20541  ORF Transcript_21382/g.20541 Transcript_21382/m.20541 type:complete len:113 (+) Transcript_21382:68-406(+)
MTNTFMNTLATFDNESRGSNHDCFWRKLFEEEKAKRVDSENAQIKYLKRLESEREKQRELEGELEHMKERISYLEKRNVLLEGELQSRNSATKRATQGLSGLKEWEEGAKAL